MSYRIMIRPHNDAHQLVVVMAQADMPWPQPGERVNLASISGPAISGYVGAIGWVSEVLDGVHTLVPIIHLIPFGNQ